MGSMNDITRGVALVLNGGLWEVLDHLHARTGMRKPTVWTKLKNYKSGKVLEHQFTASDTVDIVRLENKPMEYLYRDGNNFVFMNPVSYEQPAISKDLLEHAIPYLTEGLVCNFLLNDEEIIRIDLPTTVEVEVIEAPPYAKGDTASTDYRPVTVKTGMVVKVPPFITQGTIIKIDTSSGEYLGRITKG